MILAIIFMASSSLKFAVRHVVKRQTRRLKALDRHKSTKRDTTSERPDSNTITVSRQASKYKVHKHQRTSKALSPLIITEVVIVVVVVLAAAEAVVVVLAILVVAASAIQILNVKLVVTDSQTINY